MENSRGAVVAINLDSTTSTRLALSVYRRGVAKRMGEVSAHHRERGVHRDFLKVFSVFSVRSVVKLVGEPHNDLLFSGVTLKSSRC
jgi:hypothetical protein